MRITSIAFLLILFLTAASAQTPQQLLDELAKLKQKTGELEKIILQPEKDDFEAAKQINADVFRILPREKYDSGVLIVRGGGAYYSFVKKSHSYNDTPQIELQKNNLLSGFYGGNYGLIIDLGDVPLSEISREIPAAAFLLNYEPPKAENKRKEEYFRIGKGFETGEFNYSKSVPAVVGHAYLLRAISFDEADTLVALKIHRKDTDGSLIIFWKLLENFEVPKLVRNEQTVSINSTDSIAVSPLPDLFKVAEALMKKGFSDVLVSEESGKIVLRGKVPKGKLAEAVETAQEAIDGKPVRNEILEK